MQNGTQADGRGGDVLKGLAAGAIGGLVASFVMEEFQALWFKVSESLPEQSQRGEEQEPATVKAAEAIAENIFAHELAESEKEIAGEAVHYAVGAISGAVYGAMSELMPSVTIGVGLPFGAAVWLVVDEGAVPALGLSKPAKEYPLSTHAYALASHLVYGVTTDVVRRAVRKVL